MGACYRRTLRLPHGCGVVALLRPRARPCVEVFHLGAWRTCATSRPQCPAGAGGYSTSTPTPRRPSAHLGGEALLAPLVRAAPGLRVPGAVDGAELAVRAVLGQQVSVAAARTFAARLAARYGTPARRAG